MQFFKNAFLMEFTDILFHDLSKNNYDLVVDGYLMYWMINFIIRNLF